MGKDICLPVLAVVGGGAGFALRLWQYASAFDQESRLFRDGAAASFALVGVLALLALAFLVLVRGGRMPEPERSDPFRCPSAGYMTLMTAGAFLMMAAAGLGLLELMESVAMWRAGYGVSLPIMLALTVVLCLPAGVGALMLGQANYRGKENSLAPLLSALPAYAALAWIVALYQEHSRQPELMLYAPVILAAVCGELGFYRATGAYFGQFRGKQCLFFSLMGVVLLLTSLGDRPSLFVTVMSLACALLLLGQSIALARTMFGPVEPQNSRE